MPVVLFLKEHSKSNYCFHEIFKYIFVKFRMKGQGEADEDKVTSLKQQLNKNLDVYEKILSKQPYLAGDVRNI